MCGIVGICGNLLPTMERASRFELIHNMLELVSHRGPDGQNISFSSDNFTALGMATLSIIPTNKGLGPFTTDDGYVQMSYNGEAYNYQELARLMHVDFTGKNDTEIILAAYRKWGISFVKLIEGMFAIAIYDAKIRKLYLIRDRLGQKPVYYSLLDDFFLFGSEIKSLKSICKSKPSIKNSFYTFENTVGDDTLFNNIYLLPPATILVFDVDTHSFHRQKYWELEATSNPTTGNPKDDFQKFSELLHTAVSLTRPSEPFGLLLSGGLDSSILAYTMRPSYVFTTRFPQHKRYDETENSEIISKQIGATHLWLEPTPSDFVQNISNILYHLDRPLGNASILPEYLAYKMMNSLGLRISVSGIGIDELMLGYTRHLLMCLHPDEIPPHVIEAYSPLLNLFLKRTTSNMHNGLKYYHLIRRGSDNREMQEYVLNIFTKGGSLSQSLSQVDIDVNFPSLLLTSDHLSSAFGIENRSPFLFTPLIEFMYWLNDSQKIDLIYTKKMLREFARNIGIPAQIYKSQDKIGFGMPMFLLSSYEIQNWIKRKIGEDEISVDSSVKVETERGDYDRTKFITTLLKLWKNQL